MNLDIRLPMGSFFTLVGILLASFGVASNPAIYERSLGVNINLIWGLVLVVFGIAMILLGVRGTASKGNH
jgi:multisubunit Na+/H+ antiporter MnhG subunit